MLRYQRIHNLIKNNLNTQYLQINNESHQHTNQQQNESHFKVIIVSEQFKLLKLIDRHRLINNLLQDEFNSGLHALSMHLYSQEEWEANQHKFPTSPKCHCGAGIIKK